MTKFFTPFALAAALTLAAPLVAPSALRFAGPALADTVKTQAADPEMNAARETARRYLPAIFDTLFDEDGTSNPALDFKVIFPVTSAVMDDEVIWVREAKRTADGFTAKLSNEPEAMDGLHLGDEVSFTEGMIYDWGIRASSGKMFGHFSTRVLVAQMDKDVAAQVSAVLEENPVPPAWR